MAQPNDLATGGGTGGNGSPDLAVAGGGGSAGGGGGGAGGGGAGGGGGGGGGTPGSGLFPSTAPWYTDITNAAKDAQSDAAIAALQSKGGWGNGKMQIDFSITVQHANAATPMMSFTKTSDWYSPDCDFTAVPVPTGGALEGESGYACTGDGDCHLIVIHDTQHKLYEMWRANISGGTFNGGCLAVWDLTKDYQPHGRGEGCTCADAGGFPMAALLFTADEVAAGAINHAIRFILPNDRIGKGSYVHPATHSTNASASTTAPNSPPYGARLRLRADYPVDSLPSSGRQGRRARDAEVRHDPVRRRQRRAHRRQRSVLDAQVVGRALGQRSRRAEGHRLRHGRWRRAHSVLERLRPSITTGG